MQYIYDPGILPSSANECVLGDVYLRSNLSRELVSACAMGTKQHTCRLVLTCPAPPGVSTAWQPQLVAAAAAPAAAVAQALLVAAAAIGVFALKLLQPGPLSAAAVCAHVLPPPAFEAADAASHLLRPALLLEPVALPQAVAAAAAIWLPCEY